MFAYMSELFESSDKKKAVKLTSKAQTAQDVYTFVKSTTDELAILAELHSRENVLQGIASLDCSTNLTNVVNSKYKCSSSEEVKKAIDFYGNQLTAAAYDYHNNLTSLKERLGIAGVGLVVGFASVWIFDYSFVTISAGVGFLALATAIIPALNLKSPQYASERGMDCLCREIIKFLGDKKSEQELTNTL